MDRFNKITKGRCFSVFKVVKLSGYSGSKRVPVVKKVVKVDPPSPSQSNGGWGAIYIGNDVVIDGVYGSEKGEES